ncbi:MAG: DNA polymerase III subunit alpha [candidate division Zixibacteria bacterium]
MSFAQFVHLHNHSQYSLLDGACRIDDMLATASRMKMPALAITDHGNMFGAVEFYVKAAKHRIKPIIGMEAYVAPESRHDRTGKKGFTESGYHLVLLAKNLIGYKNLVKLTTSAYLEGFYRKPRIDKELLKEHGDGLIALSACLQGEVARYINVNRYDEAEDVVRGYLDIFGKENYYLELQNHGIEAEGKNVEMVTQIASRLGINLVATNDCHYMEKGHSKAHEVLLCIQTGKLLTDTNRMKYSTDQLYFRTPEEMKNLFPETPEAIENTIRVAEACSLELELYRNKVPRFPLPEGFDTPEKYLRYLCELGMEKRYKKITSSLQERLDFEISVILKMGYAGYFLIVKDFVDFARSRGIRVGPGRGSAAGSMVSYCLGITNLDPIEYGLLFERFLNPERVSMPDIDIDFADRGRDEVIAYVTNKYGRESVAQIITFGSMAARAAIRDVGRVMSLPYSEVDTIAKMIPMESDMTLEKALDREKELKRRYNEDENIKKLIDHSQVLEGLARHASTHAAGVVIAPGPIADYAPLYRSSKGEITTQYNMHWIEAIGLLKMDFLGLRTLTVIDDCIKLLKNRDVKVDIDKIPLDDSAVYKLFTYADTVGIFQFESSGMREYLKKLKPNNLEDLTVMNALYRPGPLDAKMIDIYIDCKHGKKEIKYEHQYLEPILKQTYGVIVFQEQVLKIARELAGYSLGEADILRKAMGKKQADIMADQKSKFLDGAIERGLKKPVAEKIFEQIETFGRYGFVKAHSACYAFIAYQTAYLKVHYPVEFMASLMSSEMSDSSRIMDCKNECDRMGIEVRPPDINKGQGAFSVDKSVILFGLTAVKNVGASAVEAIVKERDKNKDFKDLFDFCSRVDLRAVNKRTIESLAMSGALDSLGPHRAALTAGVEPAIAYGSAIQRDKEMGQSTLFGDTSELSSPTPRLPEKDPWSQIEVLSKEKDSLGYWISGHPIDPHKHIFECFSNLNLGDLEKTIDGRKVTVAGVLTNVKIQTSAKGKIYAILNLEDYTGSGEVIVFSDVVDKRRMILEEGNTVVIFGTASTREGEKPKVKGDDLTLMSTAAKEFPTALRLTIDNIDEDMPEKISREFSAHSGKSEVLVVYSRNGHRLMFKATKFKIDPSPDLISRLKDMIGHDRVTLVRLNR